MLIVAGKFDEAKALELVQKYFGAIPRPERKLDTTYTEEPPQDGERLVTLRRVGDVGAVGVAYHIPAGVARGRRGAGSAGQLFSTRSRRAGCTRRWSKRRRRPACLPAPMRTHDPGVF